MINEKIIELDAIYFLLTYYDMKFFKTSQFIGYKILIMLCSFYKFFFRLEFCSIFMKLLSSTFLESMPKDQFRCRKNIILSVKCVINDSRPSISYFMLTWFPILYSYQMPLKSFADYNLSFLVLHVLHKFNFEKEEKFNVL